MVIGLIVGRWRIRVSQSLARIAESHIVIAPSKHQVILNPQNGKRERIYVNLEAVYPTPEEPGTELSFEELWAANRGWLDVSWDEEDIVDEHHQHNEEKPLPMEVLDRAVKQKLVIHRDLVALDENGALKSFSSPKPAKGRKKKMMEVNETQISTYPSFSCATPYVLAPYVPAHSLPAHLISVAPTPRFPTILHPSPFALHRWPPLSPG
jgi:hypothetical protein